MPTRLRTSPAVPALALALATAAVVLAPSVGPAPIAPTAEATTYQVQSRTAARATQHLRSDTRLAARRVLSQSLTLSAYDLRDNQTGDLNARIGIRYSTDLGLEQRFREDPLFDARFNDLSLDVAYLEYEPIEGLEITAGRQWHRSPLGVADFDGVAVDVTSTTAGWRPFAGIAAGRDVQRGLTPFDPGAWDVQGLPPNESAVTDDPFHWMTAANAGLARDRDHRVQISARQHRRPRADDPDQTATTHRAGATATVQPTDPLTVTTTASYHSVVGGLDRARIDVARRIDPGVVSAGLDHRRPVFDSGSIFNVFGARPHRSGYATWRRPFDRISTTTELRAWARLYFEDRPGLWTTGDDRAVGAALNNRHRLRVAVPLEVNWQISAQTMTGRTGGDQYLGTGRIRAPGPVQDLYLTGRVTGLVSMPDHHRRTSGVATTAGLGAELGLGPGQLAVNLETRAGDVVPTNTTLFAHFDLEAWQ